MIGAGICFPRFFLSRAGFSFTSHFSVWNLNIIPIFAALLNKGAIFMEKALPLMRSAILTLILLSALSLNAQQLYEFYGCRTDNGWAETPMLRKTVVFSKNELSCDRIMMHVTSLGYHEVYVNGIKVGEHVLQPAVSQLDKRSLEVLYEITPYLHKGENEILLWLGQGWGRVYGTPAVVSAWGYSEKKENGVSKANAYHFFRIDSTWEASPSGYSYTGSWQPLQFGGERFDARVQPDWRPATRFKPKDMTVTAQKFRGNCILDELMPVSVEKLDNHSLLLDFGRVVTGWFQADFPALPAGTEVTMEYLDHREAVPPHTESDIYVARGSGEERFTNRFHYHAFRYVRITGADILAARALPISALNPAEAATFECSDTRLNAIHDLIQYTLQCLTLSGYMVDCPHLERMGYGGDGNSSTMTLQTMYDVRDTYRNWLQAWDDAMELDGELPYVAPAFRTGGGPYWSGFIVKAPWRTYLNYGSDELVFKYYNQMKQWLHFIEQHCEDEILQPWPDNERHTWFLGDWLAPKGVDVQGESVLHVTSCFLSECLGDMVRMAQMWGRKDDEQKFSEWRGRLNAAIHRHFYHPETHTYANGTPLDQCYALLMNIPPDSATAARVKAQLLADCYGKYNAHFAVGLVGVPVFTEWCIRERQTDLMATLLRQPDYPGYLYMIDNGATTTWESWNGERSRVHNCYNGVGLWFYQALAGLRPDVEHPGYEHFFVDPQRCVGVDWVRVTKPTRYGTIRIEINGTKLKLTVPEGTTATVFPGTDREQTLPAGEWEL